MHAVTGIFLAAFSGLTFAAEPFSLAQVEKVTGIAGLSVVPSKYDKLGKNYVSSTNAIAFTVKTATASVYDVWKTQPSMDDQAPLSGVGDDAFVSRKAHGICFKKGGAGVCIIAMPALPGKPLLVTDAQLLELARLAASNV